MKRTKAKLNLEEKIIKVEYKGLKARNTFSYTHDTSENHMKSANMKYTIKGNTKNNIIIPMEVNPNLDVTEEDDSSGNESGISDEGDVKDDDLDTDSEDSENSEDEYNEMSNPDKYGLLRLDSNKDNGTFKLIVYDNYFYITAHSQRQYCLSLNYCLE